MNPSLVSVIIPIYNAEKYIAETVKSVLAQTYTDWELILVDDGSSDNSIAICQQFSDSRISIIRQKNGGVSSALNTGIRQAHGDYLAFLDADDLWLPEKLARHLAHLKSHPDVGVSFSPSSFINEEGNPLKGQTRPKLQQITIVDLFKGNPLGNGSSAVVRRQTLAEIKFRENSLEYYFDEQIRASQDIEYIMRIVIKTAWLIEGIPEALTQYRIVSNSNSANWHKKFQDWETLLARTSLYAPDVVAKWADLGRAYQLRYLARKAIRTPNDKLLAKKLIHLALNTYWRILLEEPSSTIKVIVAAYLLYLFPKFLSR